MQMPVGSSVSPEPRVVAAGRGSDWIAQGFGLFRLQPGAWIGILLVWIVINAVIGGIGLDLVNSFLNPVFVAGMMLGCDSQARGEGLKLNHLFAAFRTPQLGQLLLSTVWILLVAIVAFGIVAVALGWPVYTAVKALDDPSPEQVLAAIGLGRLLLLVLLCVTVALALGAAVWFAPPLIVFRKVSALDALKLSFRACLRNWLSLLVYGLVVLLVLIVAIIPFGLGLLIAIPVLFASLYAAYRDIWPE